MRFRFADLAPRNGCSLAEDESLQLVVLRNRAARVLGKRAQICRRLRVDAIANHPRWENVTDLIEPQSILGAGQKGSDRLATANDLQTTLCTAMEDLKELYEIHDPRPSLRVVS